TRACPETRAWGAPPVFPAILPDAGGPPAWRVHHAGTAKRSPFCHKYRSGAALGGLFSASATAKCRILSLQRHARDRAAHGLMRPSAAESRTLHPWKPSL